MAKDKWANVAAITVVESAANTLTFQQLQTGGVLFERRAMIIHRVSYYHSWGVVAASDDAVHMGLTSNNTLGSIVASDPNVIDWVTVRRVDHGTAGSGQHYHTPIDHNFTDLPSGGIIVPAFPLYGFVQGESLAGAQTMRLRIYFTIEELSASEFVELVEAMRVIT